MVRRGPLPALAAACLLLLGAEVGAERRAGDPIAPPAAPSAGDAVPREAVRLVEEGKSAWSIVTVSRASPGAAWAAAEVSRYLQQMSGCRLKSSGADRGGPVIVIALRADLPERDRAALPEPAKGFDGYSISIRAPDGSGPARIVLAGENGRGIVYAAYDLLERMGCRWFYPAQDPEDPEVVPRRTNVDLEPLRLAVASPLRFRIANGDAWFFHVDPRAAAPQLDWAMKCRYNAMGWQGDHRSPIAEQYLAMMTGGLIAELEKREMLLHGPAHSFDQFLRAEEHMKDHPEWFGLRDGKRVPQSFLGAQFCWSNADARAEFVRNVEAFVRACPRIGILAIVPFDGGKACDCEECRRAGPANSLVKLLSEVIDRLAITAPGVLVETVGGYHPMTEPPTEAAIHPRLRIVWAHWGRYHGFGYDDPRYDRKANLEAWRKASPGGLTVCQYYTDNFAEPWVLPPFTTALAGDRRYFLRNGIESVYVLMWPRGYWWNHSLNGYLAGRCFYDASLDPQAELRDYALRYFGDDAGRLIAPCLEEWARDVDLAYHVRDGLTPGDRAKLAGERRSRIDPAVAAASGDPVLARRVGKVERLHDLAERLGELHRRREEARAAREAGDLVRARAILADLRSSVDAMLAHMRSLADLEQGLIDRDEVGGFIALRFKGWIDEEEKAQAAKAASAGGR